jgi:uncharacterized membrane protein (UPF0127 family)
MRIALVVLLMIGCSNPPASGGASPVESSSTTADPTPVASQAQSGARVTLPDGFVVKVEVAADPENRALGLMFRDRLDPGAGMLFLFTADDELRFWMKNTRIPLDMIFLDASRKIVGIQADVPPCRFDPCPSYGPEPGIRSRYVLELAGGEAKKHNLKIGDVLTVEGTEDIAVQ